MPDPATPAPIHLERLRRLGLGLNAFEARFDPALLDGIRRSWEQDLQPLLSSPTSSHYLAGGKQYFQALQETSGRYFVASYGDYPLLWLSSNDDATFAIYRRFFDALAISDDLKQLVDCDQRVVMYCGFLVVGNQAPAPVWHTDYQPGANAYTLITPLYDLAPGHGNLLFRTEAGEGARYRYGTGRAVVFGDGFLHTTEPYPPAPELRVLVSMTFGTDKMRYWDVLKQTVATQSGYMVMPTGEVRRG